MNPNSEQWYSFQYGKIETPEGGILHDFDWNMVRGAIDEIRNGPKDKPLCMYLPLTFPHPPYACEDPWFSAIDRDAVPPPIATPDDWSHKSEILKLIYDRQGQQQRDPAWWQEVRATYYAMIARLDHQWGMLCEALKDAGMYNDTALMCFSDHGDFTGDYGLVEKVQNSFETASAACP